jgi:hypothetical protein
MSDSTPTTAMTPEQLRLARHALGLPNNLMRSYRNRFLAAGQSELEWREMVHRGHAKLGAGTNTGTWFSLTLEGARAALSPAETLDREDFA